MNFRQYLKERRLLNEAKNISEKEIENKSILNKEFLIKGIRGDYKIKVIDISDKTVTIKNIDKDEEITLKYSQIMNMPVLKRL